KMNLDLFLRVKDQHEHIQYLQTRAQGAGGEADSESDRLSLRSMRGVALHAAHQQMREMMLEMERRTVAMTKMEETVRLMRIEKEARTEGDMMETERLRQEVA